MKKDAEETRRNAAANAPPAPVPSAAAPSVPTANGGGPAGTMQVFQGGQNFARYLSIGLTDFQMRWGDMTTYKDRERGIDYGGKEKNSKKQLSHGLGASDLALNKQIKFLVQGGDASLNFCDLYLNATYFNDYLVVFQVLLGYFGFKVPNAPLGNKPSAAHGYQNGGERN